MTAIFDSRLTPTLHSILISPVVFLDHKNTGLVLGMLLLPYVEAETYVIQTFFRLTAAILISSLTTVINCTSSKFYLDALPFRENRIEKFLPVSKIIGGIGSPPLDTNVTKNAQAAFILTRKYPNLTRRCKNTDTCPTKYNCVTQLAKLI